MQSSKQMSQDVEKTIFPIKVIWLALCGALLVYALLIFQVKGIFFEDQTNIDHLKKILYPLSIFPLVFTLLIYKNKNWVIGKITRKNKKNIAPYLTSMSRDDQEYLKVFGAYTIFHIVVWILNECAAILAFILTFSSGNFSYYLVVSVVALTLNLFFFNPNYKKFMEGRSL